MTEDEKFLHNMAHEFEEGFNSGDVDRIMRFYGDTYVDVNLRNPIQTKAERKEYYTQVMARPGIHLNVRPDDILIRGDLAFVRGTILLTQDVGAGRETTRIELRYLEICERVQDCNLAGSVGNGRPSTGICSGIVRHWSSLNTNTPNAPSNNSLDRSPDASGFDCSPRA